MRRVAVLLVGALLASGCSLLGGGGGQYELVAYFPKAVALYPNSQVKVLGLPAGKIKSIDIEGTEVKVTMKINDDVLLPKEGLRALIMPQSLIGERSIQLSPAWTEGKEKAPDGFVIKKEHTIIPVEPDEALQELKDFLDSLDPDGLGRLVNNLGDDLQGQGANLGKTLDEVSTLMKTFADKDQQLADIIDNLDRFTLTLSTREAELGSILSTFSQATQVLADQRQGIEDFLSGLASLSQNGLALVAKHDDALRRDIEILTTTTRSIANNLDGLERLLDAGPLTVNGLQDGFNHELRAANLRVPLVGEVAAILNPVLAKVGLKVCIPLTVTCPNGILQVVEAQSSAAAAPATLPATAPAATPIDDMLGLLGSPLVPAKPGPSTADRVADGAGAVGRFLGDAAGSLVGGG